MSTSELWVGAQAPFAVKFATIVLSFLVNTPAKGDLCDRP